MVEAVAAHLAGPRPQLALQLRSLTRRHLLLLSTCCLLVTLRATAVEVTAVIRNTEVSDSRLGPKPRLPSSLRIVRRVSEDGLAICTRDDAGSRTPVLWQKRARGTSQRTSGLCVFRQLPSVVANLERVQLWILTRRDMLSLIQRATQGSNAQPTTPRIRITLRLCLTKLLQGFE